MAADPHCATDQCTECEKVVTRAYRELRAVGQSDRDAFFSAVRVLEFRHPGRERNYYFLRVARWLAADHCATGSAEK